MRMSFFGRACNILKFYADLRLVRGSSVRPKNLNWKFWKRTFVMLQLGFSTCERALGMEGGVDGGSTPSPFCPQQYCTPRYFLEDLT